MKLSKQTALLLPLILMACHTQLYAAETGSIAGNVYCDSDKNGICDCEEGGLKNIGIKIYTDQCGGNALQTIQTNAKGDFSFENLQAGTYFVKVDLDYVCGGRVPTTQSCQQVSMSAGETIMLDAFGYSEFGQ